MRSIFKGSASHSEYVALVDSSTGLPKTGIASTDVTGSYTRTRSTRTAITLSALGSAGAAYSSGGWFEVDSTNQPGLYRFDVPDAAFASGVDQVYVTVKATGCKTEHKEFRLIDWNDQVAAIPNAAAGANGGLPTGNASGQVAVASLANNAITAAAIAADAITAAKIADGAIDAAKIADGAIDAATFAAGAINAAAIATDAIGAAELASDAVAEIQSGLMLAASYSAPDNSTISAIASYIDTEVAAIKAKTDNLPASPAATSDIPSAAANAAALLDSANAVETGVTPRGALRLMLAALAGKVSGAATSTVTIRNVGDSKTRITATVDSDGNRSSVTTDAS